MWTKLLCASTFALTLISCSGESKELKPVQQQQVGEYKVTILSETGFLQQGTHDFTLEFRRTADGQLADVGTVDVSPVMEMAGMAPMMVSTQVSPSDTPGRYKATGNLTMAGRWKIQVSFGKGQIARFNLSAQ